ncbi:hypothetical protein [Mycolicibacterium smegmatis]|uniref:hypothetical protein n=1 Tax=Mycolicibacterium smegmatis TaxID=1772 RepID=UPI000566DB41|nr:hypothetical protein [Mycolicibacterium smegmatis]
MGFIKDAKANMLREEAQRAIQQGRTVFVAMLNTPITHHTMSGSVAGWAEMIESVEACGWHLADWSVAMDAKGRPQAYPLFRRR